ncbi:MAG TPA: hypothetical protein VNT79_16345 [Phycisphaerae bacterium]|nr:hypothetical protein [Phycisphaerae bacterium]
MNPQDCPECGMERDTWPDKAGITKAGKTYCCSGCSEGTGCTCPTSTGQSRESVREKTPTK